MNASLMTASNQAGQQPFLHNQPQYQPEEEFEQPEQCEQPEQFEPQSKNPEQIELQKISSNLLIPTSSK